MYRDRFVYARRSSSLRSETCLGVLGIGATTGLKVVKVLGDESTKQKSEKTKQTSNTAKEIKKYIDKNVTLQVSTTLLNCQWWMAAMHAVDGSLQGPSVLVFLAKFSPKSREGPSRWLARMLARWAQVVLHCSGAAPCWLRYTLMWRSTST